MTDVIGGGYDVLGSAGRSDDDCESLTVTALAPSAHFPAEHAQTP
jgi:hypothetical protein